jgi:hypothetical protein
LKLHRFFFFLQVGRLLVATALQENALGKEDVWVPLVPELCQVGLRDIDVVLALELLQRLVVPLLFLLEQILVPDLVAVVLFALFEGFNLLFLFLGELFGKALRQ